MEVINRSIQPAVALETTLLVHGVPQSEALPLAELLAEDVSNAGANPSIVGVHTGRGVVGMSNSELRDLLDAENVPKANTANLGLFIRPGSIQHAATTVSATMELAAAAGVRVFATGGLGGIHKDYGSHLDVSSDLAALARFPVAVVASGVKSLLDVAATRESLESLGVPVVGYKTDAFPAFYIRDIGIGVDARFDDVRDLASYVSAELSRTGRGVVVANPIPEEDELDPQQFEAWLNEAQRFATAAGASGRSVTPAILSHLHDLSQGATLRANIALVRSNARLAGKLAGAMETSK